MKGNFPCENNITPHGNLCLYKEIVNEGIQKIGILLSILNVQNIHSNTALWKRK